MEVLIMFELMPYATRRTVMNPFSFFDSDFWGTAAGEIKTDITDTGDAFKLEADLSSFLKPGRSPCSQKASLAQGISASIDPRLPPRTRTRHRTAADGP